MMMMLYFNANNKAAALSLFLITAASLLQEITGQSKKNVEKKVKKKIVYKFGNVYFPSIISSV